MGILNAVFYVHGSLGMLAGVLLWATRGRFLVPRATSAVTLATDAFAGAIFTLGLIGALVARLPPGDAGKRRAAAAFALYHGSVVFGSARAALREARRRRGRDGAGGGAACGALGGAGGAGAAGAGGGGGSAADGARKAPEREAAEEVVVEEEEVPVQTGLGSTVPHVVVGVWFLAWLTRTGAQGRGA
ncbi:hypothetical protein CHLRE_08g371500v5 [Chlamydomonas reinhardtii]|uniref:Uncharacterized protein n=1 Tax=Chlamydomonas reinhardtii TaxID=3055 RepID=A0A2K3DHA3_CHLRE|nr:uncharacterized protein CHLRE_08g371500v5 [Chlamydomonas reinhardtii]PNW79905.1 hypothetical protein CHLRE_08g371500v5 [Chlamydomonas reinhardtii]